MYRVHFAISEGKVERGCFYLSHNLEPEHNIALLHRLIEFKRFLIRKWLFAKQKQNQYGLNKNKNTYDLKIDDYANMINFFGYYYRRASINIRNIIIHT